jgi:hypothetical protein
MSNLTTVRVQHTCNDGAGPYFGKKTLGCPRCDQLSSGASPRKWANTQADNYRTFRKFLDSQKCVGHTPQRNPGGYCITCGKGFDHS